MDEWTAIMSRDEPAAAAGPWANAVQSGPLAFFERLAEAPPSPALRFSASVEESSAVELALAIAPHLAGQSYEHGAACDTLGVLIDGAETGDALWCLANLARAMLLSRCGHVENAQRAYTTALDGYLDAGRDDGASAVYVSHVGLVADLGADHVVRRSLLRAMDHAVFSGDERYRDHAALARLRANVLTGSGIAEHELTPWRDGRSLTRPESITLAQLEYALPDDNSSIARDNARWARLRADVGALAPGDPMTSTVRLDRLLAAGEHVLAGDLVVEAIACGPHGAHTGRARWINRLIQSSFLEPLDDEQRQSLALEASRLVSSSAVAPLMPSTSRSASGHRA